ncbi:MAG: CocE/NonD family hydrolase [Candidatus Hydrogenedentota bacterium]|nr:MAG: CocE/NonD family hydrolase [Candidatus Hydrogenedentota bacterium]
MSKKRKNVTEKGCLLIPFGIVFLLLALFVLIGISDSAARAEENQRKKSFLRADLQWAFANLVDKYDKYFRLPFKKVASETPDRYEKFTVKKNVAIPMRDGIRLYANIYKPKAEGKFPVILIRLPYGKDEYYCWMPAIGKFWARKGYICVVQDVRGKFCSEGKFEPFVNEAEDGYDTIDWIARQPWCDGSIGMMGESYYGYTTWAAATTNHPSLKCVAPMNIGMDAYSDSFQNGALCVQTSGLYLILMNARTYQNVLRLDRWHLPLISMDDEAGIPSPFYDAVIRNSVRVDDWEKVSLNDKYDQIKVPSLHLAGWYDVFLKSTINDWMEISKLNETTELKGKQWLLVGPIDHESTTENTNRIGRLDIGDKSATTPWGVRQAFFDYWLKGIDNDFEKTPRVRIFVIGDNDWRYEDEWPLARTEYADYYFHSSGKANTLDGDGKLDMNRPDDEPYDSYVYDPKDPVQAHYGIDIWSLAEQLKDRSPVEIRDDVLVYSTSELEKDIEITGPISITLYASSSAVDTDFTAALVDVFPDGYIHLIQEGIIRARFRESDTKPTLIEPGKVYRYTIDLWATSYVIKAGHKIGVEISSSNFDRFDRNLNTGDEFGIGSEMIKATQQIRHTAEYPSHITLPIIPR